MKVFLISISIFIFSTEKCFSGKFFSSIFCKLGFHSSKSFDDEFVMDTSMFDLEKRMELPAGVKFGDQIHQKKVLMGFLAYYEKLLSNQPENVRGIFEEVKNQVRTFSSSDFTASKINELMMKLIYLFEKNGTRTMSSPGVLEVNQPQTFSELDEILLGNRRNTFRELSASASAGIHVEHIIGDVPASVSQLSQFASEGRHLVQVPAPGVIQIIDGRPMNPVEFFYHDIGHLRQYHQSINRIGMNQRSFEKISKRVLKKIESLPESEQEKAHMIWFWIWHEEPLALSDFSVYGDHGVISKGQIERIYNFSQSATGESMLDVFGANPSPTYIRSEIEQFYEFLSQ